jgi:hypothetical protein
MGESDWMNYRWVGVIGRHGGKKNPSQVQLNKWQNVGKSKNKWQNVKKGPKSNDAQKGCSKP